MFILQIKVNSIAKLSIIGDIEFALLLGDEGLSTTSCNQIHIISNIFKGIIYWWPDFLIVILSSPYKLEEQVSLLCSLVVSRNHMQLTKSNLHCIQLQ